ELNRLQKKYGPTVQDMLEYQGNIERELHTLQHKDTHLEKLEVALQQAKQKVVEKGKELHQLRKEIAGKLEKDIQLELKDLYLENATFAVRFENIGNREPTSNGLDMITFMLSTNMGEPLKELSK